MNNKIKFSFPAFIWDVEITKMVAIKYVKYLIRMYEQSITKINCEKKIKYFHLQTTHFSKIKIVSFPVGKITCSWNQTPIHSAEVFCTVLGMRNHYLTENLNWTAYTNIILIFFKLRRQYLVICQSKFVFVNYQNPQHSHVFFESLTNPFPKQKSCTVNPRL